MVFLTFIFQWSGLDISIKAQSLYIFFEITLWGVIAIFLFSEINTLKKMIVTVISSLIIVMLFPNNISSITAIPFGDKPNKVDITQLTGIEFNRSKYVDAQNIFLPLEKIFTEYESDAYSSILGARILFSEGKNNGFMNRSFYKR